MAVKFDPIRQTWRASYCKRHPVTNRPKSLARRGLKSKAEAKRVEAELIFQINKSFEAPPPGTILYRDLLKRFYESLRQRDISRATVENYELCLNAHTLSLWGGRPIDAITTEDIRYLIREKLSHRSPHQQKNVLKFIRGAFTFAVEAGLMHRNPVPKMQFRMGDKIKKVLTLPQAKLLLEKAKEYNHEWYPVWVTALYTGMRNGELHALTWDKVDFDNSTILVSCSWSKKDGLKDLTKSGEDRILEIAPSLLVVLRQLKLQNQDSAFVLPRIQTWDDGRQAEMLRMFLTGINLPHVRFHDLRASWATMLLSQGVEPAKVMRLGGWRDLKTMMIYVRKAGIDIRGTLSEFEIHDPSTATGTVLKFNSASE